MDQLDDYLSLITRDEADLSKAVKAMHRWRMCPRCILRFLGDKKPYSYRKTPNELHKWMDEHLVKDDAAAEMKNGSNEMEQPQENESNDTLKDTVCVTCVGILQDKYCSDTFCQEVFELVKKEHFEFDTYYLSLSIPVPIILKEHAVFIKLKELLPKVYDDAVKDEVAPIKDVWKWTNGPLMSNLLKVQFSQRSLFEVKLNFSHPDLENDCNFLYDLYPDVFRKRKNNKHGWEVFTRVNVPNALSDMGDAKFQKYYQCPPWPAKSPCDCGPIYCTHEAIFLAGRYNKYSRELSQTPWLVEGERRTNSSIEEMICIHLNNVIKAKEYKMSASGREDVDVLMLGRGRPFVVEFVNPKRIHFAADEMKKMQATINSSHKEVRVRDLQLVSQKDTTELKKGEEEKIKNYSALCWSKAPLTQDILSEKLNDIKDLVIKQKTPIRVLHRRSLAVRDKIIHSVSATVKDNHHFLVSMSTQAGTYIKEFVHGDFGRTQPNLGQILDAECDILELNVESVELDWPEQLEDFDPEQKNSIG